jgi:hypothetical protein
VRFSIIPATIFKILFTFLLCTPVIIYLIILAVVNKKFPSSKTAARIAVFFLIPVVIGNLILCANNEAIFTRNYAFVITNAGLQFQVKKYIFHGESAFNFSNGATITITDKGDTGLPLSPFGDGFEQTIVNNTKTTLYIYGITYGGAMIKGPSSGIRLDEVIKPWSYKHLIYPVDYYFERTPPDAINVSDQHGPAYSAVAVKHWITDTMIDGISDNKN